MRLFWPVISICITLCVCRSAETEPVSETARLADWLAGQQFVAAGLPSCGGIKSGPGPAANGPDDAPYYCVTPYYANLAVLGLCRARTPQCARVAGLWIGWYLDHLDPTSAADGVPCDHYYRADGTGETNCLKPGDPLLCRHNDATDSAAATFFSVLWAAHQAGLPTITLASPERRKQIESLAAVLLKLQQPDGLCWAKTGYRVKYLEDNSEVYAGLNDLAGLEKEVFNNPAVSASYRQAAERVRRGISAELYDSRTKLFMVAKFEDGKRQQANLDKWYPDTQAQLWPLLFGVEAPDDAAIAAVISAVNDRWDGRLKPDWSSHPELVNQGWIEGGDACAMLLAGQAVRVQGFVQAARRLKFLRPAEFTGPFDVSSVGWMLQILARLPDRG
jgi:hypothetical protein